MIFTCVGIWWRLFNIQIDSMLPWVRFSNRSLQGGTSKCDKNKEVAHEQQESVSLMFLPYFDVLCDLLLNRPTATWNLLVLYNDQKLRKQTDTHTCLVPLDCSRIFKSQALLFVSASSFFSLCYLYAVSSKSFSTPFLAISRILAKSFYKTASLSQHDTRHDGNCCEDFLQFRHP